MFDTSRLWVADWEVFKYDNMVVFEHVESGKLLQFHNDNVGIAAFIEDEWPILANFNIRDYDQHILHANLLDWEPQDIKLLSNAIIENSDNKIIAYQIFKEANSRWIDLPPLVDLMHDLVNKPSLKQIEGFMCSSIEESDIDFNIQRPLTDDEIAEVFDYCRHDVSETIKLLKLRIPSYIEPRTKLCELANADPLKELKHPNARLVADIFDAEKQDYENEPYIIPDNINKDNIPSAAWNFAEHMDRDEGARSAKTEKGNPHNVYFMFHGCAAVMGVGGLHACVGKLVPKIVKQQFKMMVPQNQVYMEESNDDRIILIQDVSSFYPSLIINNGYLSRSVPMEKRPWYKQFRDLRFEAKHSGDKPTANAYKLALNTFYGAMKSKTNKLSDSIQATSVCLSGQLYAMDAIEQICQVAPDTRLIQINTDGWVLSVKRSERAAVDAAVAKFSDITGFEIETDPIQKIIQRDVNNYIILFEDGTIKCKGGTVGGYFGKEKNWAARGFAYSNTIIDKAIVDYLLYGVPIKETIDNETDISRFQIITKAGKTYSICYKDCHEIFEAPSVGSRKRKPILVGVEKGAQVQKVNRLFAVKESTGHGKLMKENANGRLESFPDTPDYALEHNSGLCYRDEKTCEKLLTILDRSWYTALAEKKLKAFIGKDGRKIMADELEKTETTEESVDAKNAPTKTTRKRTAKTVQKEDAVKYPDTFQERYLTMLQLIRKAIYQLQPDGYIEHIDYEYIKTGRYKDLVSECAQAVGLIYTSQFDELTFLGALDKTMKGSNRYGATVKLREIFSLGNEYIENTAYGFSVMDGGNCVSGAQTNAVRNMLTNAFLMDTGFDDDVDQANQKQVAEQPKKAHTYVTPADKETIKAEVKEATEASVEYVQKPVVIDLIERIGEVLELDSDTLTDHDRTIFEKQLALISKDGKPIIEDGHTMLKPKVAIQLGTKIDKLVD